MKRLILLVPLISMAIISFSQTNYKEKTVFKNENVEFRQIDEHTWHGNGHFVYNESVYLIEGDSAAILIDAGTYIPGLRKIAEDIVKKPVTLIISHAHSDHAGTAISEWDTMWMNAGDIPLLSQGRNGFKGTVRYLTDGQVFDLGGRHIEVVFTPGHTAGSATFIDREHHYGFSGDAFGSTNLLVFTNLSTQLSTCQRMQRFIRKYDICYFYPGHYSGDNLETPQRVADVAAICQDILDGKVTPKHGDNRSVPNVVERNGVKVNYSVVY